jgi:hypothetical protein
VVRDQYEIHRHVRQGVKVPPSVDGKAVLDLPVSVLVSQTHVVPLANHSIPICIFPTRSKPYQPSS